MTPRHDLVRFYAVAERGSRVHFGWQGEIFEWRGPAPYHYVALPEEESADLKEEAQRVSYGWGCIPVRVKIGHTEWTTSLFPKDGRYLVPLKAAVRRAEGLDDGDTVAVQMWVEPRC